MGATESANVLHACMHALLLYTRGFEECRGKSLWCTYLSIASNKGVRDTRHVLSRKIFIVATFLPLWRTRMRCLDVLSRGVPINNNLTFLSLCGPFS